MVGLRNSHIRKILTQNCDPRDTAGNVEEADSNLQISFCTTGKRGQYFQLGQKIVKAAGSGDGAATVQLVVSWLTILSDEPSPFDPARGQPDKHDSLHRSP